MGGHEQSKSSRSGNPDGGPEPGYRVVWMDGMGWIGCNPIPSQPLAVRGSSCSLPCIVGPPPVGRFLPACPSIPSVCLVLSCLEPPYRRRRAGSTAGGGHTPLVSNVTSAGLLVRLLQRVCKKANLLVPCRCMCTSLEQSRRTDRDLLARRGAVELPTSSSLLFCGWRATSGRRTTMW
jgi:hypothetical protein